MSQAVLSPQKAEQKSCQLSLIEKAIRVEPKTPEYVDINTVKPLKQFTVLETFAGAGGLALGLEKAGFKSVGLIEVDKQCCQTLRQNGKDWNVIEKDIREVVKEGIRNYIGDVEVDLISGGYPCQSFSYAGQKLGLEDIRGTMFFYYAELLKELKPKMFFAENVRGLVSHENGKTLQTMIDVFTEIGYNVRYEVLNAVNYGVPQKRERVVIIGIRKDLNDQYRYPKKFDYVRTLKDALKDVPTSEGSKYPPSKVKVFELVKPGGCWRDLPDDIAREYMGGSYFLGGGKTGMARKIAWDEPCLTLTCSPAQKQTERCHPDEIRPFTVREYARIQSFPDEVEFCGSVSSKYKQIGNAVPVDLAYAVGLSIIDVLNRL